MRLRLFAFLFLILFVVSVCSALLDNYFVNQEKISFIDQELNDVASVLLKSDLGALHESELAQAEGIISKELGGGRLGKFFVIRDRSGKIRFETAGLKLLPVSEVPTSPQWVTLQKGGKFVRVLNLPFGNGEAFLQAGFVADENLILNPALARRDVYEVIGLPLVGLLLAWALARKLLNPLHRLAGAVSDRAALSTAASVLPLIDERLGLSLRETNDEFQRLVTGLNALIARVNRGYEVSRIWSYQMAHELKTPMAILTSEIEMAEAGREISKEVAERMKREVVSVSDTVSAFLLWAEVEGATVRKDLHVVLLSDVLKSVVSRRQIQFPGRFDLRITTEKRIAVSVSYLEIVLNNLLSNALHYSSSGASVEVIAHDYVVEIRNQGAEIPAEVLSRMGEPFNRGPQSASKGHGLGLATVSSIARVFGWKVEFPPTQGGTTVLLDFSAAALED